MTLDDAIALALQGNRQLRAAGLAVKEAESLRRATAAQALPEIKVAVTGSKLLQPVDFIFETGVLGSYPIIGPIPGERTSVQAPAELSAQIDAQLNQPISQLPRIHLAERMRAVEADIAREAVRAQRQAVVSQVREAWYGLAHAECALAAAERSLEYFREVVRNTQNYALQRTTLRYMLLEARARLLKQEHLVLEARDGVAIGREQLNLLLGRPLETPFELAHPPPFHEREEDLPVLRALAVQQRPDVRQAGLRVRQAELDLRLKRSEFTPDVGLQLRYQKPYGSGLFPSAIVSASAVVEWEPVDFGRRGNEVAEKSARLDEARTALEESCEQAVHEVGVRFRKARQARAAEEAAEASLEAARERVRVAGNRFSVRDILLQDLLEAEAAVAEAQRSWQEAGATWAAARAALARSLGEE